jgi:hypothetical protein
MQLIIHTLKDFEMIQGKFVLQVDLKNPDTTLMDFRWDFAKEKRLYLVSNAGFINLYGHRREYENFEYFKNVFNYYHFKNSTSENSPKRFHRLLTTKELQYLFQKIAEENY